MFHSSHCSYYFFFLLTTFKGVGNGFSNARTQLWRVTNTLLHVEVLLVKLKTLHSECVHYVTFPPPMALQPNAGHGLLILDEVSRSHTTTHHSRWDSSGRVISPSQRPVPDNTQHSQQTNIHALGGIRTHNLSRRAAADLRLRPRGHWDRLIH